MAAGWRRGLAAALLALAACGGGPRIEVPQRPALPPADFPTQSDQFAELQRAALAADYVAFARSLNADDEQAVQAMLTEAFGGGVFDIYTADVETDDWTHRRLVELRGSDARLYLYLGLNRAPGGWNFAGYELGRDRSAIARHL